MEGRPCVLKTICEINSLDISHNNGLLGHVFHVLFSPSTSKDENLDIDYYEAEVNGKNLNCDIYNDICPKSLMELISFPIETVINKFK